MRALTLTVKIAVLCSVLVIPGWASAQDAQTKAVDPSQVVTSVTVEQVKGILEAGGYKAVLQSGNDGTKYLKSQMSGYATYVFTAGCSGDNCSVVEFYLGFTKDPSLTVNYANAWNNSYRFARAYIESDGNFSFEYDVSTSGGVTLGSILEAAKTFDLLVEKLKNFNGK
ncbi:MAG TPA: YbjN domain-containing protein [Xanthobacteraceae bacterium]|nr:YbjN domain-containing protein [Xanthobacteraceae bacterium]